MPAPYVLVSACLLGEKVRYDGGDMLNNDSILRNWRDKNHVVSVCPEVSSGLSTPRPPAEIQESSNGEISVITITQQDVTSQFRTGAQNSLQLCLDKNIKIAILTESSPSCGTNTVYDGSFNRNKITGQGITTLLLRQNKIAVFNQFQIQEAYYLYERLN